MIQADVKEPHDAETAGLAIGLGRLLLQANNLFMQGAFVQKIIAFLDPLHWLWDVKAKRWLDSKLYSRLFVDRAKMIANAGIELVLC